VKEENNTIKNPELEQQQEVLKFLSDRVEILTKASDSLPKISLFNKPLNIKYKDGERRMKIYIKLDNEQTENFKFVRDVFKDTISSDEMTRAIFLKGLHVVQKELVEGIERVQKEKAEIENQISPPDNSEVSA
jgi:hypothetical protein